MTDKDGFWRLNGNRVFCNTSDISEMCILTSQLTLNKRAVSHISGDYSGRTIEKQKQQIQCSNAAQHSGQLDFLCSVKHLPKLCLFKGSDHQNDKNLLFLPTVTEQLKQCNIIKHMKIGKKKNT